MPILNTLFSCFTGAILREERNDEVRRSSACSNTAWNVGGSACTAPSEDARSATIHEPSQLSSSSNAWLSSGENGLLPLAVDGQPPRSRPWSNLKVVSSLQDLLAGISLDQREPLCGPSSAVWNGVWRGAKCNIKFFCVAALEPVDILKGVALLTSQSHPFILQYFVARALRITSGTLSRPALECARARSVQLWTDSVNADPPSIGIESLLGSAFYDAVGEDQELLGSEHTIETVLDYLKPAVGDFLVVLVTELCIYGDLRRAIRGGCFQSTSRWSARLSARAALCTAREVALGLLHLHLLGAAHGNLRPSQVLLMESHSDRRGFVAKIADAGLAPRHGPNPVAGPVGSSASALSAAEKQPAAAASPFAAAAVAGADEYGSAYESEFCSRFHYTAPELMCTSEQELSVVDLQAADVYSFGCLMFELLTSQPPPPADPWVGAPIPCRGRPAPLICGRPLPGAATTTATGTAAVSAAATATATAATAAAAAAFVAPGCHPGLLRLCLHCLSTDPAGRPSFAAVLTELNALEAEMRAHKNVQVSAPVLASEAPKEPRPGRLLGTIPPPQGVAAATIDARAADIADRYDKYDTHDDFEPCARANKYEAFDKYEKYEAYHMYEKHSQGAIMAEQLPPLSQLPVTKLAMQSSPSPTLPLPLPLPLALPPMPPPTPPLLPPAPLRLFPVVLDAGLGMRTGGGAGGGGGSANTGLGDIWSLCPYGDGSVGGVDGFGGGGDAGGDRYMLTYPAPLYPAVLLGCYTENQTCIPVVVSVPPAKSVTSAVVRARNAPATDGGLYGPVSAFALTATDSRFASMGGGGRGDGGGGGRASASAAVFAATSAAVGGGGWMVE